MTVITYNAHSVMSETRLTMLLLELEDIEWDIVVVEETWREPRKEVVHLQSGHIWYGSGGCRGRCGVGFLVHKRIGKCKLIAINERLAVLDVDCVSAHIFILGVYIPDSSYDNVDVDEVYCNIQVQVRKARRRERKCIIAGDSNAHVRALREHDDNTIIGRHGWSARNPRGEWLVRWCSLHGFVIANTQFGAGAEQTWTYQNGGRLKQLDYILIEKKLFEMVRACYALQAIDIGSDHRAVAVVCNAAAKTRVQHKSSLSMPWVSGTRYSAKLDEETKTNSAHTIDTRVEHLESAMKAAAEKSQTPDEETPVEYEAGYKAQLRILRIQRRDIQSDEALTIPEKTLKRRDICKAIQKLLRQNLREKKERKIRMILSDFKGLKHIPRIKGTCGKKGIDELKDKDGNVVSDAKGVVNIFASFYESLYSRPSATGAPKPDIPAFIPEECTEDAFDIDELIKALKSMKNRKAEDEAGIIAEMIKEGSRDFLQLVLEMFNDIFMHRTELPSSWKKMPDQSSLQKGAPRLTKKLSPYIDSAYLVQAIQQDSLQSFDTHPRPEPGR